MVKWSKKDYERITGEKLQSIQKSIDIPTSSPIGIQFINNLLTLKNINYKTEYRFHKVRRFKFDFALLDFNFGIEYEGLVSEHSRHTNIVGYSKDCEKYNLAQLNGWKVLRYTALNYKNFENDLNLIINGSITKNTSGTQSSEKST